MRPVLAKAVARCFLVLLRRRPVAVAPDSNRQPYFSGFSSNFVLQVCEQK
jgi:hypothetical protein